MDALTGFNVLADEKPDTLRREIVQTQLKAFLGIWKFRLGKHYTRIHWHIPGSEGVHRGGGQILLRLLLLLVPRRGLRSGSGSCSMLPIQKDLSVEQVPSVDKIVGSPLQA